MIKWLCQICSFSRSFQMVLCNIGAKFRSTNKRKVRSKHHKNFKKLPWKHFIDGQDEEVFFITVTTVNITTITISVFEFYHYLFFLSFEFCHNWVFEVCHNLGFWVLLKFEFLSLVTIWVFEFCHNLSFWVCHNLSIWNLPQFEFEFCPNWSFWVLLKF